MNMDAIVVVDPYSTGALVSLEAYNRGYTVIALWTDEEGGYRGHNPPSVPPSVEAKIYASQVEQSGATLDGMAAALRKAAGSRSIIALICGGESGVKVTDALSEHMGLRGNGTGLANRRDKRVQQDAVRRSGLRAVREACGTAWEDVASFLETESLPVVVKPVESAGSDGVKLCRTKEEAEAHFKLLMTSQRKLGAQGAAVLVQEFLAGEEFVIDQVTRDGVHKTVMVWSYEKAPANGAQFVYYNMRPVPSDSAVAQQLVEYTSGCLDAIQIRNGATHSEVMLTADGPCLVEVNCRCGGFNGSWVPLATALTGYSQVTCLLDAFVDAAAYDALPLLPAAPFKKAGCNPFLVSKQEGVVRATPGFDAIAKLSSCVSVDAAVKVGDMQRKTIDLFTQPGQCVLVHADPAVVEADIKAIRKLEDEGLFFQIAEEEESAIEGEVKSSGSVAGAA